MRKTADHPHCALFADAREGRAVRAIRRRDAGAYTDGGHTVTAISTATFAVRTAAGKLNAAGVRRLPATVIDAARAAACRQAGVMERLAWGVVSAATAAALRLRCRHSQACRRLQYALRNSGMRLASAEEKHTDSPCHALGWHVGTGGSHSSLCVSWRSSWYSIFPADLALALPAGEEEYRALPTMHSYRGRRPRLSITYADIARHLIWPRRRPADGADARAGHKRDISRRCLCGAARH